MAQGFEVLPVSTIWVKVRAGLSDILHRALGEMPGRALGGALPEGVRWHRRSGIQTPPGNLPVPPCFVAGSSRPPADASGGQEKRAVSPQKPWIEAQGRVAATKELTGGVRRFLIRFGI